ncbi:MAG: sigma-70 family RNA polymerase sigma factor [Actinomycetota bacterium]
MGVIGRHHRPDYDLLVARVRSGEADAWDELVEASKRVAWHAIMSIGLGEHDGKDAFAATYFRLFEHLDTIEKPSHLPGWIATTARREALAVIRSRARTTPTDDLGRNESDRGDAPLDEGLLDDELLAAVAAAVQRLDARDRQLLALLCVDPPISYDDISVEMGMKRGSIGPTRRRILDKLRQMPELRPFLESDHDDGH